MTSLSTNTGAVRLVGVREDALDLAEVTAAVADRSAGGVDVFLGVVRDHDSGQPVTGLEYVGHPTALARLEEVAAEVAAEFDVVAVAAVHRVGHLEIGDTAVICAVSARHRPEAFEATRALIDRLKERVPIWKHQHYADGSEDWVEPGHC
ncbi:MAG: molybdenum cofactor biosynthesis protein MoaE [Nocardioidaceae bacterium]|nr:molybdenum cofactor biosynthesis protein MoaE [Nocardioidaceae bacterium]